MPGMSEKEFMKAVARLRLLVLDVDGVMTDGSIILDDNAVQYKAFNVRDGHGVKMLQRHGVEVAIITGRTSKVVEHRAKELGIERVLQGSWDKAKSLTEMLEGTDFSLDDVAYMGDDVVDLPVMRMAGLSLSVADAHPEVLKRSDWVSSLPGGGGALRELTDTILKAKGLWDEALERYLEA